MSSVFEAQGYSIDINAVKDQLKLLGHEVSDEVIMNFIKDVYLPQRIAQAQQPQSSAYKQNLYPAVHAEPTRDQQSEQSTSSSYSASGKLQRPSTENLALADAIETDDNVVLSSDDEFNFADDTNHGDFGSLKPTVAGQRSPSKHTPIELRGDSASDWNDDFGLGDLKIAAQTKLLNQQTKQTYSINRAHLATQSRQDTDAPQHTSHTILPDTATSRDCSPSRDSTQRAEPLSPSAMSTHTANRITHPFTSAPSHLSSDRSPLTHHHNTYANIESTVQPTRHATHHTTSKSNTTTTTTTSTYAPHTRNAARPPSSNSVPQRTTAPDAPASAAAMASPFLPEHHPGLPPQHRTRPTYAPAAPEPEPSLSNYSVRSTSSRSSTLSSAAGGSGKKKVDRVNRYHQLAAGWEKDRFLKRNDGRPKQAINFHTYFASVHAVESERQQQRKQAVRAQTKKALEPASSYKVPTEKRRDSLRWEVRTQMRRVEE